MSALGAAALAVSVFLPWYRISSVAHSSIGASSAHPLTMLATEQALPVMKIFLLVLAGLALLDALLPLVRVAGPVPGGAGGSVALLGLLAVLCVFYRLLDPPALGGNEVALSLREGPWLALLAALVMTLGGMWPRRVDHTAPLQSSAPRVGGAFPGLPG